MMATPAMGREERALVRKIREQIGRCTKFEERLAARRRALIDGVRQLQRGRPAAEVLTRIQERVPEAVIRTWSS